MAKTPVVKSQAEQIYQSFGITLTDAVNILLRKSVMEGGLPFDMRRPNAATEADMCLNHIFFIYFSRYCVRTIPAHGIINVRFFRLRHGPAGHVDLNTNGGIAG